MTLKSKAKPKQTTAPTAVKQAMAAFDKVIEQTLKQLRDPATLGATSPFAAPYFLGAYFDQGIIATDASALARGEAVQRLLFAAAENLVEQHPRWGQLWRDLLQATYFRPTELPVHQVIHELHLAEATYHRHRNDAIHALAEAVMRQVKPALRLENAVIPVTLVGRDEIAAQLLAALKQGQSVGLMGAGGVGKTTLGRALAQHFAPETTFWYTFTPGLNDHSHSLLFALAWFLQGLGVTTLWSQLMADQGAIKTEVALNLLRYDLAQLGERQVLCCFDEVDLLRPRESEAHAQLLPWLDCLRGLVPLLCIGQKMLIEVDLLHQVDGLTAVASAELLQQAVVVVSPGELSQLHGYTQGNPRLLTLFTAFVHSLQRGGEPPAAAVVNALTNFAREPSLEFLLRRVWQHLNESEMALLELLAVFRNPFPRSAWNEQAQQAALDQLLVWRLVQVDAQGGVYLLPAFRDALYQHLLTSEEKELLHLEAATLRAQCTIWSIYGGSSSLCRRWVKRCRRKSALYL